MKVGDKVKFNYGVYASWYRKYPDNKKYLSKDGQIGTITVVGETWVEGFDYIVQFEDGVVLQLFSEEVELQ